MVVPLFLDVIYFLQALLPIGELLLRFILGDAIRFLDLAGKPIALAQNHVELVIGELAPLLFDVNLELLQLPSMRSQQGQLLTPGLRAPHHSGDCRPIPGLSLFVVEHNAQ
jgi:hypothetical protein